LKLRFAKPKRLIFQAFFGFYFFGSIKSFRYNQFSAGGHHGGDRPC
jgi:hypothetical protein